MKKSDACSMQRSDVIGDRMKRRIPSARSMLRQGKSLVKPLMKRAQGWVEWRWEELLSLLIAAFTMAEEAVFYLLSGAVLAALVVGVSAFSMLVSLVSAVAGCLEKRGFKAIASVQAFALEVAWVFGAGRSPDGHYIRSWLFEHTARPDADDFLISFDDFELPTALVDIPLGSLARPCKASRILPHLATCKGTHGMSQPRNEKSRSTSAAALHRKGHVRYSLLHPQHQASRGVVVLLHGVSMTADIWSPYICALRGAVPCALQMSTATSCRLLACKATLLGAMCCAGSLGSLRALRARACVRYVFMLACVMCPCSEFVIHNLNVRNGGCLVTPLHYVGTAGIP